MNRIKLASEPLRSRSKILTNSAAEFVELRAAPTILDELGHDREGNNTLTSNENDVSEFDPVCDRFWNKEEAHSQKEILKESDEQLECFQTTLRQFNTLLEKQDIFKKLSLTPRDPTTYDVDYVIEVANKINDYKYRKDQKDNTQRCRAFMQKCAESIASRRRVISGILSMIPGDAYGSVISGGFSLILLVLAAEVHQAGRVEIQSALADIPRKLEDIKRFAEILMPSPNLYRSANGVFIAIFAVLERIIAKLSKTLMQSIAFKLKGKDSGITEALEALDYQVSRFKVDVDFCRDRRLGQACETMQKVVQEVTGVKAITRELENRVQSTLQEHKALNKALLDSLYQFLTSNPAYNPANNTVNARALSYPEAENPTTTNKIADTTSPIPQNKELAADWLEHLGDFEPTSHKHIKQLVSGLGDLEPDEQDKFEWILKSGELQQWQRCMYSTILDVRPEDSPEEDNNALSLASAIIQTSLETVDDILVMGFFCGLRTTDSRHSSESGPMALLNSLNGQFVRFLAEKRASADMKFLGKGKLRRKSTVEPKYALQLFEECLQRLPEREIVVIIIDGFSRLTGNKDTGHRIIKKLCQMMTDYPDIIIKILITDALPTCPSKDLATHSLYVPNEIDGDRNDVDVEVLRDESRTCILDFQDKRQKEGEGSAESSDESGNDSDW
ncbi:uncharacterized protein FMAN_15135 [Fusarium mangiferae]|uniref:Fungal STAND N-terminal Goodbye domain-containing protein n=1 Tax=Fusarium mangiferae TaxID=192010 RepID=A0A1L7TY72_FUSMA|nr:uncharacterized protein FMAN_15135 [Fusarium mangiferae]CVL03550.1 uncharacterized protein FMAN_15135 [Fusarium mangiferae]